MDNKIRLLHSFPKNEVKFKDFFDLTFDRQNFHNTVVDSLVQCKFNISDFDILIIHYLKPDDIKYLLSNYIEIPVIWFAWGFDFYNLGKLKSKLLLPRTQKAYFSVLFKYSIIRWLKEIIIQNFPFVYDCSIKGKRRLKAINLLQFMIPVVPGDYYLLKNNYRIKPQIFHANYVSPLLMHDVTDLVNGNNILLGNSADPMNNHFDSIDALSRCNLDGRKVIIPLSYGGFADYVEKVIKYATAKLGRENILILREFLPFEMYNEILLSCSIVVMNHVRQQAMGNIIQALLQGANVYLRKESTIFDFLISYGLNISLMDSGNDFINLTNDQILVNVDLVRRVFNPVNNEEKLNGFFQMLKNGIAV